MKQVWTPSTPGLTGSLQSEGSWKLRYGTKHHQVNDLLSKLVLAFENGTSHQGNRIRKKKKATLPTDDLSPNRTGCPAQQSRSCSILHEAGGPSTAGIIRPGGSQLEIDVESTESGDDETRPLAFSPVPNKIILEIREAKEKAREQEERGLTAQSTPPPAEQREGKSRKGTSSSIPTQMLGDSASRVPVSASPFHPRRRLIPLQHVKTTREAGVDREYEASRLDGLDAPASSHRNAVGNTNTPAPARRLLARNSTRDTRTLLQIGPVDRRSAANPGQRKERKNEPSVRRHTAGSRDGGGRIEEALQKKRRKSKGAKAAPVSLLAIAERKGRQGQRVAPQLGARGAKQRQNFNFRGDAQNRHRGGEEGLLWTGLGRQPDITESSDDARATLPLPYKLASAALWAPSSILLDYDSRVPFVFYGRPFQASRRATLASPLLSVSPQCGLTALTPPRSRAVAKLPHTSYPSRYSLESTSRLAATHFETQSGASLPAQGGLSNILTSASEGLSKNHK
ncbi:hypothetical protein C8R45DRAFT_1173344 [Mycena sanguinolenta]|nr:hypothetical protein C8R45DRAFT_1173344 [Mycena sanguinolenta]